MKRRSRIEGTNDGWYWSKGVAQATTTGTSANEASMDDPDLVDALRAGDPDAPRILVERFQAEVLGLCARMLGNRHDAEDAAQESLVRAIRGCHGFDRARPLRPWILGIAANRCRTELARRSRRPRVSEEVDERVESKSAAVEHDDLAAELELALDRLRPEYRLVFILYHEQELTYEAIGEAIDRPVGTVKTWLHRARGELASRLSRRGFSVEVESKRS